jgi:hypothetical protein
MRVLPAMDVDPPTYRQTECITRLCMALKIRTPYEELVQTKGEAGKLIRTLIAQTKEMNHESHK